MDKDNGGGRSDQEEEEEDIWWYVCTLCSQAFTADTKCRAHKRLVHGSKDVANLLILSQTTDLEPRVKVTRCYGAAEGSRLAMPQLNSKLEDGADIKKHRTPAKKAKESGRQLISGEKRELRPPKPKPAARLLRYAQLAQRAAANLELTQSPVQVKAERISPERQRVPAPSPINNPPVNPHLCKLCSTSFATRTQLRTHVLVFHVPTPNRVNPNGALREKCKTEPPTAPTDTNAAFTNSPISPRSVSPAASASQILIKEDLSLPDHLEPEDPYLNETWTSEEAQEPVDPIALPEGEPLGVCYYYKVEITKYKPTAGSIGFYCSLCGAPSIKYGSVRAHIRKEHDHHFNSCGCIICGGEFGSISSWSEHIRREHTFGVDVWKCAECQYLFRRPEELEMHAAEVGHPQPEVNERKRKTVLPEGETRDVILHNNIEILVRKLKDNGKIRLFCSVCNASAKTTNLQSLQHHIRKEHNPRQYCLVCQISFKSLQDLVSHAEEAHVEGGDYWSCEVCQMMFKNELEVVPHKETMHHPRIPARLQRKEVDQALTLAPKTKSQSHAVIIESRLRPRPPRNTTPGSDSNESDNESRPSPRKKQLQRARFPRGGAQSAPRLHQRHIQPSWEFLASFTFHTIQIGKWRRHNIGRDSWFHCYSCNICGWSNHKLTELRQHIRADHDFTACSCLMCEAPFERLHDLELHMKEIHESGSECWSCIKCLDLFKEEEEMRKHSESNHGASAGPLQDVGIRRIANRNLAIKVVGEPEEFLPKLFPSTPKQPESYLRAHNGNEPMEARPDVQAADFRRELRPRVPRTPAPTPTSDSEPETEEEEDSEDTDMEINSSDQSEVDSDYCL